MNCNLCGRKATSVCANCKKTYYCSRECQVKDFQKHKSICGKLPDYVNNADAQYSDRWFKTTLHNVLYIYKGYYFKDESNPSIFQKEIKGGKNLILINNIEILNFDLDKDSMNGREILHEYKPNLVNIVGDKIRVKELDSFHIAVFGTYVDEDGCVLNSSISYNTDRNQFVILSNHGKHKYIPLDRTYLSVRSTQDGKNIEFVKIFNIYEEQSKLKFKDYDDAEKLCKLSLFISNLNTELLDKFNKLVNSTKKKHRKFKKLDLVPSIDIICIGGKFTLYPPSLNMVYSLTNTMFHKTSFDVSSIEIDHKIDIVKSLFVYCIDDKLPTVDSIIRNKNFDEDIVNIYKVICDYIGIDFYYEYFDTISKSSEYGLMLRV